MNFCLFSDFFSSKFNLHISKHFSEIPSECQTVLDPDQARHFIGPDLHPNCFDTRKEFACSILARSHTFVEIDHEIISTAILLPFSLIQGGLLSVTSKSMCMKYWFITA